MSTDWSQLIHAQGINDLITHLDNNRLVSSSRVSVLNQLLASPEIESVIYPMLHALVVFV